ncbi:hypothetical protein PR048_022784 [Dryococelus australis]|uniref:Importin N-terminal domain-containing protein n=1 Tax=Dryococelus australis TaxID=614101 RepID=A0ABQ9GS86_9NEOP|nr:hypothetical protein PR048_022784 [Dryococelus australis]
MRKEAKLFYRIAVLENPVHNHDCVDIPRSDKLLSDRSLFLGYLYFPPCHPPEEHWLFQQRLAARLLTSLKEHPDAWTRVDTILEYSHNQQTKYYALQILEEVIKTRWKALPRNQCEGNPSYFTCKLFILVSTSSFSTKFYGEHVLRVLKINASRIQ